MGSVAEHATFFALLPFSRVVGFSWHGLSRNRGRQTYYNGSVIILSEKICQGGLGCFVVFR